MSSGKLQVLSFFCVDVSTLRNGGYDWIELVITPFDDNLVHPAADIWQAAGPPDNSIQIALTPGTDNIFSMVVYRDGVAEHYSLGGQRNDGVNSWIAYATDAVPLEMRATRRETFELTITDDDRLSFGIVDYFDGQDTDRSFYWLNNVDISPLDWNSAVVQLQHFSFDPTNNRGNDSCDGTNWHLDNGAIKPAIPFFITKASARYVDPEVSPNNSVSFATPSGSDSFCDSLPAVLQWR